MFETPERKKQKGEDILDWAAFENEERKRQMEHRKKGVAEGKKSEGQLGRKRVNASEIYYGEIGEHCSKYIAVQNCGITDASSDYYAAFSHSKIRRYNLLFDTPIFHIEFVRRDNF